MLSEEPCIYGITYQIAMQSRFEYDYSPVSNIRPWSLIVFWVEPPCGHPYFSMVAYFFWEHVPIWSFILIWSIIYFQCKKKFPAFLLFCLGIFFNINVFQPNTPIKNDSFLALHRENNFHECQQFIVLKSWRHVKSPKTPVVTSWSAKISSGPLLRFGKFSPHGLL